MLKVGNFFPKMTSPATVECLPVDKLLQTLILKDIPKDMHLSVTSGKIKMPGTACWLNLHPYLQFHCEISPYVFTIHDIL